MNVEEKGKLFNATEAATILHISTAAIYTAHRKGHLRAVQMKPLAFEYDDLIAYGKKRERNIECISRDPRDQPPRPFGSISLEYGESLIPLDLFWNPKTFCNPMRAATAKQYAVSNYGRVFDLTIGREVEQAKAGHGYLQCGLRLFTGESRAFMVHRLIGFAWMPNDKLKNEVHHIDGNKGNNHANNLVFVTKNEQSQAHALLNEAKKTGNYKDYNDYINAIQKENKWTEELRWIFDPDNCGSKSLMCWLVTKTAYEGYISGLYTLDSMPCKSIRGQFNLLV